MSTVRVTRAVDVPHYRFKWPLYEQPRYILPEAWPVYDPVFEQTREPAPLWRTESAMSPLARERLGLCSHEWFALGGGEEQCTRCAVRRRPALR